MLLFLELTNKGEAITISTSIKLPVGIENFEEIRTGGYYYVDKTKLIKQKILSTQMTICGSNCARFMMMHALV